MGETTLPPADPDRRRLLQGLPALCALPLLPWCAGAMAAAAPAVNALPRAALVIGNSRYRDAPLLNPANDAGAIAGKLKALGFTVSTQIDAGKAAMEQAVRAHGEALAKTRGVGLFYFAGHGVQVSWHNFLVPVDASLGRVDDLPNQAVDLGALLRGIGQAGNAMNIVILDACRDNPFGGELKSGKGLSQMDAPIGTLLAYATAPGNAASDGAGGNGLYTESLLREVTTPEAKIEDVFKRVRLAVRRASRGRQVPWESTSLEEDFYFVPPASVRKLSEEELERQFAEETGVWERAQQSGQIAPIEDYLRRYPSGRFAELAQSRLDRLLAQQGERKVRVVGSKKNPYSIGTASASLDYRVGDRFFFRIVDLLTGLERKRWGETVTAVRENEILYSDGKYVTDLLGNWLRGWDGATYGWPQIFAAEYSLGRKWTTRFEVTYANGRKDLVEYEFKVTGRETVTVPAGTFDAFRVEGNGWTQHRSYRIERKYWVAPDKVPRFVAMEALVRDPTRITVSDRIELLGIKQVR